MTSRPPLTARSLAFQPTRDQVKSLIADAQKHPLGIEFLQGGALDAVAATFQVHAFTVEKARATIGAPRQDWALSGSKSS